MFIELEVSWQIANSGETLSVSPNSLTKISARHSKHLALCGCYGFGDVGCVTRGRSAFGELF